MGVSYKITLELRTKLKAPFGKLIRGSFAETMKEMAKIVKEEEPPKLISVGDIVTRSLHCHQMPIQLSIIDNRCMRKRIKPQIFAGEKPVYIRNPRGTITNEAIVAIRKALKSGKPINVIVDGEEDLLTLVAVLYAPERSLIVYGQPNEGIVLVKVTSEKKAEVEEILKAMKKFES